MSHLRQLAPVASADVNSSACDPPAQVIGLSTNWKLQLPVDEPNSSYDRSVFRDGQAQLT